jgi:tetratricopeptide (TPR) repeat protein
MGQYAGWSFEQLFEQKHACMQANLELELELHRLDWSDRDGRADIYATLERNVRTVAAVEAEIEERRARQARDSLSDLTNPTSSRSKSGEGVSTAEPAEAKAAKLFRRGSYALTEGWVEDAVRDLLLAVSTDFNPYHPQSWFNLAVAQQQNGDSERAAEAFTKCVQYGIRKEPALAAAASLRAAELWRGLGQPDKSAKLLRDSASELDRCAELHLALAVYHGEVDHLRPALELAPALAADARTAGATAVEAVAAELCEDPAAPPARLRALEQAASAVANTARSLDLSGTWTMPPRVLLSGSAVERLVAAAASLPRATGSAVEIAAAIRQAQKQLDEGERTARASAKDAEARAAQTEAVVRAGPREIYAQAVPSTATPAIQLKAQAKVGASAVVVVACIIGVIASLAHKHANETAGHTGSGQGLLAAVLGIIVLIACYIAVTSLRELAKMRAVADIVRDHNNELKRASQNDYTQQQQNDAQARMAAEHAREAAEQAARTVREARAALESPLAVVDGAVAAATPPTRTVPFAGQLASEP